MSQKCNGAGRKQLSQAADLGFKTCNLGRKTAIFVTKQPYNPFKTAKRRKRVRTLHVRLDLPVGMSCLRPFKSTICPWNGPKRPQKPQIFMQIGW